MTTTRGKVIAAAAVGLALLLIIVVVSSGDSGPEQLEIDRSSTQGMAARGELLGEDELLRDAAQAWRDQARGDKAPDEGTIYVKYANPVPGSRLPVTGDAMDAEVDVVVLTQGARVATLGRRPSGEWDLIAEVISPAIDSYLPVWALGGGLFLFSQDVTQTQGRLSVVELPEFSESEDAPTPAEESKPVVEEVDVAANPLVELEGREIAVQLPSQDGRPAERIAWLHPDVTEHPLMLTADRQTETSVWERLTSEEDGAGTAAAISSGIQTVFADREVQVQPQETLELDVWHLGVADSAVPGGERRVNAMALGNDKPGSDSDPDQFFTDAVTAGLTGDDGQTVPLVVGEPTSSIPAGPPVAATWVKTRSNVGTFVVYAAAPTVDLELRIGSDLMRPRDSVGLVVPDGTEDGWLPTSLIGLDDSGQSWPAMPIQAASSMSRGG